MAIEHTQTVNRPSSEVARPFYDPSPIPLSWPAPLPVAGVKWKSDNSSCRRCCPDSNPACCRSCMTCGFSDDDKRFNDEYIARAHATRDDGLNSTRPTTDAMTDPHGTKVENGYDANGKGGEMRVPESTITTTMATNAPAPA
ncbi:hypothetical protein JCM10212_006141 [Sporobolomyces blumeae]